jgi:hypothetical protein
MKSQAHESTSSSVFFGVVLALLLATCPGYADDAETIYRPIEIPDAIRGTSQDDLNAVSGFNVSDQVASQYLAVTLEVTKTSITPIESTLVRGPASLPDSSVKDLQIRAFDTSKMISNYSIADPRFRKREPSSVGTGGTWFEQPMATQQIFVPLSSLIDKVEVLPESGRSGTVSAGGVFDPRPWATAACSSYDPDLFPNCGDVIALGIPPPP